MDHAEVLLNHLQKHYKTRNDQSCNVTLEIDSAPVLRAHGIILAANSEYLQQALTVVYPPRATTVLDLQSDVIDVNPAELVQLVDYAYTGKCIPSERLSKVAEALRFNKLGDFLKGKEEGKEVHNETHALELLLELKSMRERGILIDCVFHKNKIGILPAHRQVLSVFSTVLAKIFANLGQKAMVTINIDAPNFSFFRAEITTVVEFIYGGNLEEGMKFQCLQNLDNIAKRLDVKELVDITSNRLTEWTSKLDIETFVTFDERMAAEQYKKVYEEHVTTTGIISKFTNPTTGREEDDRGAFVKKIGDACTSVEPIIFKCTQCEHTTNSKDSLKKHERIVHSDDTPFACSDCFMAFKSRSNFLRHQRSHQGLKPYECKKCGIAYAEKKSMDKHVLTKHLGCEPIHCTVTGCKSKFLRLDRYQIHCKRVHKAE